MRLQPRRKDCTQFRRKGGGHLTPQHCFRQVEFISALGGTMIEPGSASRVPAGRFAAHKPVQQQCRTLRGGSTPETSPWPSTLQFCVRVHPVCLYLKGENPYGSRKTRHKAPCEAQKVFKAHKRLFSNKEQAVPIRSRSGESRGSLSVSRSPCEKAAVPQIVDSARGSGGAIEWVDVWSADSRAESCWRHAGSQSSGGHRCERCGGIRASG